MQLWYYFLMHLSLLCVMNVDIQTDRQAYIYFLLSHTRGGASPHLFCNNYSIFYLLLLILQKWLNNRTIMVDLCFPRFHFYKYGEIHKNLWNLHPSKNPLNCIANFQQTWFALANNFFHLMCLTHMYNVLLN